MHLFPASEAWIEYEKERWCLEQAAAVGVPGPAVLHIGQTEDRAYMIQTFVPGENGADSPADRVPLWHELGRLAGRIHSIPFPSAEKRAPEPPASLFGLLSVATPREWLRQIEEGIASVSKLDILREHNVYERKQRDILVSLWEDLKTLPFRAGLNHGDLSLKNTIVDQDDQVSLLDWGSALVQAVPYYDLSQIVKNEIESNDPNQEQTRAFLRGYGLSSSNAEKRIAEATTYLLLRAFAKARWAVGRAHPKASLFVQQAKDILLRRLLEV